MHYHPRLLEPLVLRALRDFPVVVVTGGRQCGKRTLVQNEPISKGRSYQTLDDLDLLDQASNAPQALLSSASKITLDEVQREPRLLIDIKRQVDRKKTPGQFLLTGSANILQMHKVTESLAGRAVYLTLYPMSSSERRGYAQEQFWNRVTKAETANKLQRELEALTSLKVDLTECCEAGGYPPVALGLDSKSRWLWFDGYARSYLERDIQEISEISSLSDFRRVMKIASLRIGNLINQTEIGRDSGIPQSTVHRYLNILETTYQIFRLQPFSRNRTKRLIKTPKLYWIDTGLLSHLRGGMSENDRGPMYENLVLQNLLPWIEAKTPKPEIYFWRSASGQEIDFVLEFKRQLIPIEVKAASRISSREASVLMEFQSDYPKECRFGIVLYGGSEIRLITDTVLAVPISAML